MDEELGWMYETWHPHCDDPNRVKGKIEYTVWSDIFTCPECSVEINYWDKTTDLKNSKVEKNFNCSNCGMSLSRKSLDRVWDSEHDSIVNQVIKRAKRIPVWISYSVGKRRFEKPVDIADLELINKSGYRDTNLRIPVAKIEKGDKTSDPLGVGFTHIHHYYSFRTLQVLSSFLKSSTDSESRRVLLFTLTSGLERISLRNGYRPQHRNNKSRELGGPLPGNLYIPIFSVETNPIKQLETRVRSVTRLYGRMNDMAVMGAVSTQSTTELNLPESSVDYIFVDPPFGSNLMYSELNYATESWLYVKTMNKPEAVINRTQGKRLTDYQSLMENCFAEMLRILKPGRWMTVEFHNSQNAVWNSIQEGLMRAGFVVADVRSLARNLGTLNQISYSNAVKQDLIISAYKPQSQFEQHFLEEAGTEAGAWDFIRQHLAQLPVVVEKNGVIETLNERQDYLLFDRMVAFHIQRGASVPLSANEFYAGLRRRFIERDGMFFLSEQVPAYDKARLQAQSVAQLALFVSDEKSSIQWLRQQLTPDLGGYPQTYQDIQPRFLKQLHQSKYESLPELSAILEENFLQDEQGRWYAPDPNKATDLEKLRRKSLLREFNDYRGGGKRLKQFRTEAVRAGFAHAWQNKEYALIIQVGDRLPEQVLQEDPDLLMYYDNASLLA
jgi:hypothetical protein